MGSRKIKKIVLVTGLLFATGIVANEYAEFQKQQQAAYTNFKQTIQEEFEAYSKAHNEAYKEFSKQLLQTWPEIDGEAELSTKSKFVEYTPDLQSKKVIDYEKEDITLEVVAKTADEARNKMNTLFDDLLTQTVKDAHSKDILEQKISTKLKKPSKTVQSTQELIGDILTAREKETLKKEIEKKKLVVVKHKDHFIYKANVKMPSDSVIKKAKTFKKDVLKNAQKQEVPASLIFAIMHSESSFNPMARSHIPAFGLMQIVPKSAGIDSYRYLYNEKKLLSSSYLYNPSQNITIGSAYLHILYFRYLKKITNPQSRLYCTIAAYNTGAGNVARTFTGSTNISKAANSINKLTPEEVYQKLISNLPYNETRKYLKKVNDRVSSYNTLLQTKL